jgi:hypothetical protein
MLKRVFFSKETSKLGIMLSLHTYYQKYVFFYFISKYVLKLFAEGMGLRAQGVEHGEGSMVFFTPSAPCPQPLAYSFFNDFTGFTKTALID